MSSPIIHRDVVQGELQWVKLHLGRPTASEFSRFMTSDFEYRKSKTGCEAEMAATYLNRKLAEKLLNHALPGFSAHATEQGTLLEEEALPWFSANYELELTRVGFVEGADGRCGCSPDSLIGDDSGLEVKCPQYETHVGYVRAGKLPTDYRCQVYGSMYVTGRASWHFFSYARGIKKKLHLVVERDEEVMAKIAACLNEFYWRFDRALEGFETPTRSKE